MSKYLFAIYYIFIGFYFQVVKFYNSTCRQFTSLLVTVDDKDIRSFKYRIYVMKEKRIQRYVSLVTVTERIFCMLEKIVNEKERGVQKAR